MIIKKCDKCGALVRVLNDCSCDNCGIICCGDTMREIIPNSVDAAVEKHVPAYTVDGDVMNIEVNHVMDDDHFIEWVSVVSDNNEIIFKMKPGDTTKITHKYIPHSKIYAYCNLHGLWVKEVE